MPNVSNSIELDAPPEQVWALITDLSRQGEWLEVHDRWPEPPPSELSAGTSYKQGIKLMGMPAEVSWSVTAVEPPNRLALEGQGPMGTTMRATWAVEARDGGSTLSYDSEFAGGALAGPMGETVAKQAGDAAAQSLTKLRDLVTAPA